MRNQLKLALIVVITTAVAFFGSAYIFNYVAIPNLTGQYLVFVITVIAGTGSAFIFEYRLKKKQQQLDSTSEQKQWCQYLMRSGL